MVVVVVVVVVVAVVVVDKKAMIMIVFGTFNSNEIKPSATSLNPTP